MPNGPPFGQTHAAHTAILRPVVIDLRDGPRDECGVFGIHAPGSDVARLTYFGLYALQHRGQESAGIAASQGGHIMAMRDKGLVNQVFDEQKLRALRGEMAIGHVRYSTTGANSWENTQPVWRADKREVALAHNGNLVNAVELHAELRAAGVTFRSTSDSEIIAALLSTHASDRIEDAVADVMGRVEGAYSTVVMTRDRIVAFRDPAGLRPLSLGMLGDAVLRRLRDLRVRHHRRDVPARRPAGRDRLAHAERDRDADGRRGRAHRAVRVRAHLLRAARLAPRRPRPAGLARPDGRDPRAGGAGRRRPRDRGAGLRQRRGARLRARHRDPPGRRLRQEPLRRADVHPARPGAAQARPADEVQPAARHRRRQAARRRRRLDRPRQHHAPDRADAARRRARARCTCASRRRRSATPATTASTCRRATR